jgi:osmoprotectant transport system substrate-binding protein
MTRRSLRWLLALLVPFSLVAAACGDDSEDADTGGGATTTAAGSEGTGGSGGGACAEATAPDGAPAIVIGAQDFGESAILAQLYAQCFEAAGYDVRVQEVGGFRDLEIAAFDSGDINFAPEYAASMLEFLNDQAGQATSDAAETTDLLNTALEAKDLVALEPSDAVDTNAFVVTQETADADGVTAISDLADHTDYKLGAPADCETNAFCLPGLQRVYGVDLSGGFTALETGAIPDALDAGEIDVALLFSTDATIADKGWVLLEDDQSMLAADNILPVLTAELNGVDGLADLADAVSATLTTDNVTAMNKRFAIDRDDADTIAGDFLADAGLL